MARAVFHGQRGELRQQYREGQEDQLGALGLMLNIIVYWNTLYIEEAVRQLRVEGFEVDDADLSRIFLFIFRHINMNGKYTFSM